MTTQIKKPSADTPVVADPTKEAVERLAGLLPAEELEKALQGLAPEQIVGPGGLLTQLAGRVIETALGAELTEHLGLSARAGAAGRRGQPPQRRDAEDAADRARPGGDQDAPRSQRQLRAAAGGQAPDAAGRAGREDPRALRRRHERP